MNNKNPLEFDASILQECAKRLYSQADNVVMRCVGMGLLVGIFAGVPLSNFLHSGSDQAKWITGGIVVFLGFMGYLVGSSRAFKLRLEAQHVLCQVAIERNTRLPGRV